MEWRHLTTQHHLYTHCQLPSDRSLLATLPPTHSHVLPPTSCQTTIHPPTLLLLLLGTVAA
jgi:hypothetical protein